MNKNFITFFLVLIFGLMITGFVRGAEKSTMIIEPNPDYHPRFFEIQKTVNVEKQGVIELTPNEIDELRQDKSIIVREPYKFHVFLTDAIVQQNVSATWNLKILNTNLTGSKTSVCIIDTGIDSNHPDLENKTIAEHCFCADSGCCPDGTSEDDNATDDNGHGTHVAGIVGASGQINGIGIGANLVIVKALNSSGEGSEVDLINATQWCVDNSEEYNITVISASLGADCDANPELCYSEVCSGISILLQSKIQNAIDKNISVVIATGNNGNTTHVSWPSCLPNVTRVASIDKDNLTISSFSNRNSLVKLLGIGRDVNSTMPRGDVYLNSQGYSKNHSEMSGTSMATPMVAGAIAILKQYLNLSGQTKIPSEVENILYNTGLHFNESSNNFSRIDVYSAIFSLDIDAPNITLVSPTNNKVNLTNNQTFTCNATDWQLANLTLYVWNSTGLYFNETKNLTGTANETSFDLTNISEGIYSWNCLSVDAEGNSAYALTNYSLTIGGISVNLLSPSNENYTNANTTNFSCQVLSDANNELSNVTFYLWNSSGDLNYSLTTNISNFDNTTIFNYTFIREGNYSWNCLGVNNISNESWGENNLTITYDITTPNLTLISLPSGATSNSISKTFSFNVSDDNIGNCSLIIGGAVSLTNSSMNVSLTQSFSKTFTPGTYVWEINCSDLAGNVNSSAENSFTITAPVVVSSSGGGGVTSSTEPKVYEVNVAEISAGYTKSLKNNEKVNFSIFDFEGGRHLLTINEVGIDNVNITIESDPINLTLGVGQSIKLNLTSKIYYDLFIQVNKIVAGEAELTIQLINEPIEVTVVEVVAEQEIVEVESIVVKDYSWIIILLTVFFILVGIIILKLNRKKLKALQSKKKHGKKRKKTKS